MHFLHVVQLYYPVATGAGRYFAEVGERLAREGHRVTVLATDAYDLEYFWNPSRRRIESAEEFHNGVRIVRLPDMARFFAANAGERFDLVHTCNITLDFAILPALDFARERGIPFVCTPFVHLGPPGDRSILRYYTMRHQIDLLKRSDRVITM